MKQTSLAKDLVILAVIGLIGAITWLLNFHLVGKTRWAR
jgi:hypothetical protein